MSVLSIFREPFQAKALVTQVQELKEISSTSRNFYDLQEAFQKYKLITKDDVNFEPLRSKIFSLIHKIYMDKYPKEPRRGFDGSTFLKYAEDSLSKENERLRRAATAYVTAFKKIEEEMCDFSSKKERQVISDIYHLGLMHLSLLFAKNNV